jgi:hypothetical protein
MDRRQALAGALNGGRYNAQRRRRQHRAASQSTFPTLVSRLRKTDSWKERLAFTPSLKLPEALASRIGNRGD